MNIKMKIYDLKHQQKELSDRMGAMLEKGETGEEYDKLEKQFDELQAQVEKCEKQLARESRFEGNGSEGNGSEGNGDPVGKAFQGGAQAAEKVYESGRLKGLSEKSVKAFAATIRKTMTEGTGAAGGFTVPEDIRASIYRLVKDEESMLDFVFNDKVNTDTGSRTYMTRAQHTGFQTVEEAAAMPVADGPTFGKVDYSIKDRGNVLPISNDLEADSDEHIVSLAMEWFVGEYRASVNSHAVALARTENPVEITGLDTILAILTGLGSALRAISTVHTNQSGLLYLQSLKDGIGRPLLQPNPTDPMRMVLSVGSMTVPVKDWPDNVMPNTDDGKIPFVIGSLKEGIFRFDREQLTMKLSREGTIVSNGTVISAVQNRISILSGYVRDDYKVRDAAAFVYAVADPSKGKTLESILIAQAPTKTAYAVGEALDLTGIKVLALYTDGTYGDVTNACTFDPDDGDTLAAEDTSIAVSYTLGEVTKTATQAITVTASVG